MRPNINSRYLFARPYYLAVSEATSSRGLKCCGVAIDRRTASKVGVRGLQSRGNLHFAKVIVLPQIKLFDDRLCTTWNIVTEDQMVEI